MVGAASVGRALSVTAGSWVGATGTTGAISVSAGAPVVTMSVVGVSDTGTRKVHAPKMDRIRKGRKNAIFFMDPLPDVRIAAASP